MGIPGLQYKDQGGVMKYIECIHCQKRYGANAKHMAAIGKKVRCTNCGKSFPILVYEAKPAPSEATHSEAATKGRL